MPISRVDCVKPNPVPLRTNCLLRKVEAAVGLSWSVAPLATTALPVGKPSEVGVVLAVLMTPS